MSKKRYIDTNFWSDTWVDNLTKYEKLFFLYLLTNERTTIAGIYEIPLKRIMLETEFDKVEIGRMLKRMESKVHYADGWIVLRNAIKSQNYTNDKIKRGIKAILETCPVALLQHINLPKDFDVIINRPEPEPKQQGLFNETSMGHDETSMTPEGSLIELNRIKYNSIERNADKPPGFKRNYRKAAEADREQATRAKRSFERKPAKSNTIMTPEDVEALYRKRTIRK
jgi:hypothetical protein